MNLVFNHFKKIIDLNKKGFLSGIYSICSINNYVLEASIYHAKLKNDFILIESTCNQVNQFGGYSKMTPENFKNNVFSIAKRIGFPIEKVILGGDHIGPFAFRNENPDLAIEKSKGLVSSIVEAGYSKIHIDTSMALKGDLGKSNKQVDKEVIVKRGIELVKTAEETFKYLKNKKKAAPVYVIGTDIPTPGGSDIVKEGRRVTSVSDLEDTISLNKEYFYKNKLYDAWERVVAVVVQPGVEHGDHKIIEYKSDVAKDLVEYMKGIKNLIFEGHTSDYQTAKNLRRMVKDGICILKVGPSLTNAFKEAIFLLSYIEEELAKINPKINPSKIREILDKEMLEDPVYWIDYYKGSPEEKKLARKYSFFDRSRYYWWKNNVNNSLDLLLKNLYSIEIPLSLLSQFLPLQYKKIREGLLRGDPYSLIRDRIINVLDEYSYAVGQE